MTFLGRHKKSLKLSGSILSLSLVFSALSLAQPSTIFFLKIQDDAGGIDSLNFGNKLGATFGLDTALAEYSSPPDPPGFWAKFTCPRTPVPADWGLGLIHKDIRDWPGLWGGSYRIDSFYIYFKNDDAAAFSANVRLTWTDTTLIGCKCDSMILEDPTGLLIPGGKINMGTMNGITLTDPYDESGLNPKAPVVRLHILKYNIHLYDICDEGAANITDPLPATFTLSQNYPNPFNPSTTIHFDLPKESQVTLKVYNLLGQEVMTLMDGKRIAGEYDVPVDGTKLASGVYMYELSADRVTQFKKMLVVK